MSLDTPSRRARSDLRLFPVRTSPVEELVLLGGWLDVGLTELPFIPRLALHRRDERKPKVRPGLSDASYPRMQDTATARFGQR